jgi:hypothetical protein
MALDAVYGEGLNEFPPRPGTLTDLMAEPNHKGHIIGPGEYRIHLVIAAENAPTVKHCVSLTLTGHWFASGERMLRDGVGVTIE